MSDVATKTAVVVSDGISYKLPGQGKPVIAFGFAQTYVTLPAARGDEIELDQEEYDRFKTLGAIADPGTKEADAAKAGPVWGAPAGAVQISAENANLPIDKLRQEAVRLGLMTADQAQLAADEDDDAGVSGAAPDDESLPLDDPKKLERQLNVAQLKHLAGRHGVTVEDGDTKPTIAEKISAAQKS